MKIAGIVKNSFVDFPGRIATVVFTPGCNMNCWYCHNAGIKESEEWNLEKFYEFINQRKNFIDGVVFSGGEVTLQPDLKNVIKKIKELGLEIKLDTNGLNPDIIKELLDDKLLDYVAMDIKAPLNKYNQITGVMCDINKILSSIELIMNSGIEYEFRTTFSPDLSSQDILDIVKNLIGGAELYSLQQYRTECYNGTLNKAPHEPEYVKATLEMIKPYVKKCVIKGLPL